MKMYIYVYFMGIIANCNAWGCRIPSKIAERVISSDLIAIFNRIFFTPGNNHLGRVVSDFLIGMFSDLFFVLNPDTSHTHIVILTFPFRRNRQFTTYTLYNSKIRFESSAFPPEGKIHQTRRITIYIASEYSCIWCRIKIAIAGQRNP